MTKSPGQVGRSEQKDIDLPVGDSLYIRINYESVNRIGFSNTSPVNPATGAGSLTTVSVSNQYLVYAAEVNDLIRQSIFTKFNSGDFTINADHVERLELPEEFAEKIKNYETMIETIRRCCQISRKTLNNNFFSPFCRGIPIKKLNNNIKITSNNNHNISQKR